MAVSVQGTRVTFLPPPGAVALVGDMTDWKKKPPLPVEDGRPLTLTLPRGAWVEYAWLDAAGAACTGKPEWLDGPHGIFAHVLAATHPDGWEWEASTYYHSFVLRAYRHAIAAVPGVKVPAAVQARIERAAATDELGQVAAVDVLHHQPVLVVLDEEVEDGDDVRVVEAGRQLGLALGAHQVGGGAARRHADLRRRAEHNTRAMLEGLLKALGFTTVVVEFEGAA